MSKTLLFVVGLGIGCIIMAGILSTKTSPPTYINQFKQDTLYINTEGEDIVGKMEVDGCLYFIVHSPNCTNPLHYEIADSIIPDELKQSSFIIPRPTHLKHIAYIVRSIRKFETTH